MTQIGFVLMFVAIGVWYKRLVDKLDTQEMVGSKRRASWRQRVTRLPSVVIPVLDTGIQGGEFGIWYSGSRRQAPG